MAEKKEKFYALMPVSVGQRFYGPGEEIKDQLTPEKRDFLLNRCAITSKPPEAD